MQVFAAAATTAGLPHGRSIAALEDARREGVDVPPRHVHGRGGAAGIAAFEAVGTNLAAATFVASGR